MHVGIVGLGYVGLTLGVVAADSGNNIYGIEINPYIKECLSQNRAHFFEPGLNDVLEKINGKSFRFGDAFPADEPFDVFVITVGTPLTLGSKSPNMDYIASALKAIEPVYTGKELVILRSTVSVGTSRNVIVPPLAQLSGLSEHNVLVAMCPERTVEGKAIQELTHLPQIIGGNNAESIGIAKKFFSTMTNKIVIADSLEEAEMDKLFCNTYRDMSFAIANAFCDIAQSFGVDGIKAIEHAREGYDRAPIPLPGFVAGPCLEKDAYILTHNANNSLSKDFILDGRAMNESLEDMVVAWVEKNAPSASTIALTGMAFKGRPATNDLRGSSSVRIAQKLKDAGFRLRIHDFVSTQEELKDLGLGQAFADLSECCKGAVALLVLNNHLGYEKVDADAIFTPDDEAGMPLPVLDVWNACPSLAATDRVKLSTLGNVLN